MFPNYGTDPVDPGRETPEPPRWTCPVCLEDCTCPHCGAHCTEDCVSHDFDAAYVPTEET